MIQRTTTKYKHTHMAFVEALNKLLAENLFKIQDAQELNDPNKASSAWVKHLYGLVDKLNNTKTQMIWMSPKNAIEFKEVPLAESYSQRTHCLRTDCIITYYNPVENITTSTKRATDRIWSEKTYRLSEVVSSPGNQVMYYLADGLERAFIKEELMVIPEDTELPPDFVQK